MGKQNVVSAYPGMLVSLKKETLSHTTTWVNAEDVTLSEINQSRQANTVRFYFHGISKVVQFKATESGVVVPRAGRGEGANGELVFSGCSWYSASVLQDKNVLEMCCIMWMYVILLNSTLRNGSNSKFYVMYVLL